MDSVARPVFDSLADGHDQWYETGNHEITSGTVVTALVLGGVLARRLPLL